MVKHVRDIQNSAGIVTEKKKKLVVKSYRIIRSFEMDISYRKNNRNELSSVLDKLIFETAPKNIFSPFLVTIKHSTLNEMLFCSQFSDTKSNS